MAEMSCAASADPSVSSTKKRKRDGSKAGDIALNPSPVRSLQSGIPPSVETGPWQTVCHKKKKKKGNDGSSSMITSFVFASKDLKCRSVPVSLYVRTTFAGVSANAFTSFISVVPQERNYDYYGGQVYGSTHQIHLRTRELLSLGPK